MDLNTLKSAWDFVARPEILTALLAVLGGLKVVARYTKWTWDDKVLSVLEWPLKKLVSSVSGSDKGVEP